MFNQRTGDVFLDNFDAGMIETMGAYLDNNKYYLRFQGLEGGVEADNKVQVLFMMPEQYMENYILPSVVIRRNDVSISMNRFLPFTPQYRIPAPGAIAHTVDGKTGYDLYEERPPAIPVDILYDIEVVSRYRREGQLLLRRVLRVYGPYGKINVKDSLGQTRTYEAYMEGMPILDELTDIAERVLGFAISVRIEGELDVHDVYFQRAVTERMHVDWKNIIGG